MMGHTELHTADPPEYYCSFSGWDESWLVTTFVGGSNCHGWLCWLPQGNEWDHQKLQIWLQHLAELFASHLLGCKGQNLGFVLHFFICVCTHDSRWLSTNHRYVHMIGFEKNKCHGVYAKYPSDDSGWCTSQQLWTFTMPSDNQKWTPTWPMWPMCWWFAYSTWWFLIGRLYYRRAGWCSWFKPPVP